MLKRTCKICGIEKDINDFQKGRYICQTDPSRKYWTYQCKLCLSRYKAKKEKDLRDSYAKNFDVSTVCMTSLRTQLNQQSRKSGLKVDYSNLTVDWYREKLVKQNRCCEICGVKVEDTGRRLVVDHCHTTGKVRGLLCSNCNLLLGHIESIKDIKIYYDYLNKYKE